MVYIDRKAVGIVVVIEIYYNLHSVWSWCCSLTRSTVPVIQIISVVAFFYRVYNRLDRYRVHRYDNLSVYYLFLRRSFQRKYSYYPSRLLLTQNNPNTKQCAVVYKRFVVSIGSDLLVN